MTVPESRSKRESRRVTVTAPIRRSSGPVVGVRELAENTPVGDLYLKSLIRSQLNLGIAILTVFVVFLAGIPLLFSLAPRIAQVRILHIPLVWLLLGAVAPPLLVVLAFVFNKLADRNEHEFIDLVTGDLITGDLATGSVDENDARSSGRSS
jgi:uncharacterized Tic20 family protein